MINFLGQIPVWGWVVMGVAGIILPEKRTKLVFC
jgi:hypothetical protein